jgi:hypothetical protein
VEQAMQVVEAHAAMAADDRQAGRSKRAPGERPDVVVQGWERWVLVARRAATVAPLDPGPEPIPKVAQLVEQLASGGAEREQVLVEVADGGEQLVSADLEIDSDLAVEARGVAHGELGDRSQGDGFGRHLILRGSERGGGLPSSRSTHPPTAL